MNRLVHCSTLFLILFVAISVCADDAPNWVLDTIKKYVTDRNELAYDVVVQPDVCDSIDPNDVFRIVKDEMVRSRIKPCLVTCDFDAKQTLVLSTNLSCVERDGFNPIFQIGVEFVIKEWNGVEFIYLAIQRPFGYFGIGDKEYILQQVENSVENALTAYIRANFDL